MHHRASRQGQAQGQAQAHGFQATGSEHDWPSKDEFMRIAGWLWGVMDRTESLLRAMDAVEGGRALASDLGMTAGPGPGQDNNANANTNTNTNTSTGTSTSTSTSSEMEMEMGRGNSIPADTWVACERQMSG
jgi:hypothetical protein